jgi:hypothetical protein
MIEYGDVDQRREALAKLGGIEDTIWVQAQGGQKVYAIANEDLDRSEGDKASAVHFLRFELGPETIAAFKAGAAVSIGIDHEGLAGSVALSPEQIESLGADLA